jgi:serine/threonine protein kinase
LVQRFQREAQAASALNHPNVITIYDLGTAPDGKPYIVMDYLDGQSLDERIESVGMLPLESVLNMFIQVCGALNAAHDAGIIHRDIKPSNIMLTTGKSETDVVKVVDFGLAKMLEPGEDNHKLTKTGEVFGTLLYMSPEQCLGHPLDPRTDIYSVGCTMYEALIGVPIFRANSPFELMSKHINTMPEPFGAVAPHIDCPLAVEAIVMKTLAKNRDERHQTIGELQKELEAALAKLKS